MRSYIRHPTDIPIEISFDQQTSEQKSIRNVSRGGLCFLYPSALPIGSLVSARISLTTPPFEANCRVTWCQVDGQAWQVGVEFLSQDDLYKLRMVEQICHIEQYRRDIRENQGRTLSSQEAAIEWIERYAESFHFSETDRD